MMNMEKEPNLIERCYLVAMSEAGAPMAFDDAMKAAKAVASDILAGRRCAATFKRVDD